MKMLLVQRIDFTLGECVHQSSLGLFSYSLQPMVGMEWAWVLLGGFLLGPGSCVSPLVPFGSRKRYMVCCAAAVLRLEGLVALCCLVVVLALTQRGESR